MTNLDCLIRYVDLMIQEWNVAHKTVSRSRAFLYVASIYLPAIPPNWVDAGNELAKWIIATECPSKSMPADDPPDWYVDSLRNTKPEHLPPAIATHLPQPEPTAQSQPERFND